MSKPKIKKVKDPNAPKRCLSAYFIWLKDNRDRLKKDGMTAADVAKLAGVEWNKVSDKTQWQKQAEVDKARYQRELAAYKKKNVSQTGEDN